MSSRKKKHTGRRRPGSQPAAVAPTTERLAAALELAGAPAGMVARARAGVYDEYRSELPFPLIQLVTECRKHGLDTVADQVGDGVFDATVAEADAWARSADGQRVFAKLFTESGLTVQPSPPESLSQARQERLGKAAFGPGYEAPKPEVLPAPPPPFPLDDDDVDRDKRMLLAAADVAMRSGGFDFDFNYAETPGFDGAPATVTWEVSASYPAGVRIFEDSHPTLSAAAWSFMARLVHGSRCRCKAIATLDPAGALATPKVMLDGRMWTMQEQLAAGVCVWSLDRSGEVWRLVGGCGAGVVHDQADAPAD